MGKKNYLINVLTAILFFIILTPFNAAAFYFGGEKPLGLAGAYTALADDTGAIFMNPAGLAQTRTYLFDFNYETDKMADSKLYGISILDSITSPMSMGLAYYKMGREDAVLSDGEEVIALAISEMYTPNFFVGLGAKYIEQKGPSKHDYTGDVGILYYFNPKVSLGLVGKNLIGTDFNEVHKMYTGGLAYRTGVGLGLSFDLTKDADTITQKDTIYSFGAELLTPEGVIIRGGYMSDKITDKDFYSFNINYSTPNYSLGYSVFKDEADKDNVIQNISLKIY